MTRPDFFMFIGMLYGSLSGKGREYLAEIDVDPKEIDALEGALKHIYKQTYAEELKG